MAAPVTHARYKPVAGSQMSTPNVIPMADIMLVLLIIFMVVTPMLQKDHPVDLARTNTAKDMQDADKEGRDHLAGQGPHCQPSGQDRIREKRRARQVWRRGRGRRRNPFGRRRSGRPLNRAEREGYASSASSATSGLTAGRHKVIIRLL